jgi:Fic family protein
MFFISNLVLQLSCTNMLLLQAGYLYVPYVSHEKIVEEEKARYYTALRKSQGTFGTEHENIVPWLGFFLNVFYQQSRSAIELLSFEQIEKLLSPKQLTVWRYLVTVPEATPGEITRYTGVARPTVNQVLTKLLDLKRIERLGQGRGTRYKKI